MSDQSSEATLFVKAGADGKRYGACPFCQRVFMIMLLKAKDDKLRFKVATVNLAKPPEEFKKLSLRHVPAVAHADAALDNMDDIVDYLDRTFPSENLAYENAEAERACKDLFQKFCFFVKEVSKDESHLLNELEKLNSYLLSVETEFLCAHSLTHLDCEVLPKLHHIRVASSYLKKFDFPPKQIGLWKYLKHAYANETFVKSCPSDQEIILHWADRPDTRKLSMEQHSQLTKSPQTFTTAIPDGT